MVSGGREEFHTWPSDTHYEMWVRFYALISNHCSRIWSDMYFLFNLILYMCRLMVYTGWWMGTTLDPSTLVTQVLLSHLVNTKAFCRFLECAVSYIFPVKGATINSVRIISLVRVLRQRGRQFRLSSLEMEWGGYEVTSWHVWKHLMQYSIWKPFWLNVGNLSWVQESSLC